MIIEILKKSSRTRKKYEVEILKKSLENVKFLLTIKDQMSMEVLDSLHCKMKYEYVPRRRAVFNLGETGKKFYIILKGAVYILLKKEGLEPSAEEKNQTKFEEFEEEDEKNQKKEQILKKIKKVEKGLADSALIKEVDEISDEMYIDVKYPNFMIMRTLKNSESFGDLALRQNVARHVFS